MSYRFDSTPLISSSYMWGNRGHGELAENIPSTGEDGPGYLYDSLSLPADNGKEIRGEVTAFPAGTFAANEDSSFQYDAPSDGARTATVQIYVDGVSTGSPITVTLTVGSAGGGGSATNENAIVKSNINSCIKKVLR